MKVNIKPLLLSLLLASWALTAWAQNALHSSASGRVPVDSGAVSAGWRSHQDPAGFSVSAPPGWTAHGDSTGRVEVVGQGAVVEIWPVFLQATTLDRSAAAAVTTHLAGQIWPAISWSGVVPLRSGGVRMIGADSTVRVVCALAWVSTAKGTAAYFYGASAPTGVYARLSDTFASILQSFRVIGTGAKQAAPEQAAPHLQYVTWRDPREGAFTSEIPQGWSIEGGLFRSDPYDYHAAFDLFSPDGQILIRSNDPKMPTFHVPFSGFPEGSKYLFYPIRRYETGLQFAQEYGMSVARQFCNNIGDLRPAQLNDLAAELTRKSQGPLQLQFTAGEVTFSCQRNGRPMTGYALSANALSKIGNWAPQFLYAYVTPSERQGEVKAIIVHILESWRIDPNWLMRESNASLEKAKIVSRNADAMREASASAFFNRSAAQARAWHEFSNATLGVVDVTDPATGRRYQVENSSNYHWIDPQDHIVGTNTYSKPGIDFREMVEVP